MDRERLHYFISDLSIKNDGSGRSYATFVINKMDFLLFLEGWDEKEKQAQEMMQLFVDDDTFIEFYNDSFKEVFRTCLIHYLHTRHKLNYSVFNSTIEYLMGPKKCEHIIDYYKMLRTALKFI
jgi:hypothetical protein